MKVLSQVLIVDELGFIENKKLEEIRGKPYHKLATKLMLCALHH
jgi:hypothetical protein